VSDAATAPNVLVVDDELQIRRFLRSGFELDGYSVNEAENGREAIRAATLRPTDLIILDLALPDLDGSQVLERIRSWSNVPIIILSVKSSEMEKVRLFELGADDYVTKPFGMAELLARSKVVLRRKARATTGDSVIRIDHLKIDLAARNVFVEDERLTLTPKEYRLLQILAQYPGNVVTHQELLKEIWGLPHINDTHYLRIVVRKLRQKIELEPNHPRILLTELGVGYRLAPPNDPADAQAG
jgi:two-component system, OmpR family, KDP operon response regulator KdpE